MNIEKFRRNIFIVNPFKIISEVFLNQYRTMDNRVNDSFDQDILSETICNGHLVIRHYPKQ